MAQSDPPIIVSGGNSSQSVPLPIAGGALPMDPPLPTDNPGADL